MTANELATLATAIARELLARGAAATLQYGLMGSPGLRALAGAEREIRASAGDGDRLALMDALLRRSVFASAAGNPRWAAWFAAADGERAARAIAEPDSAMAADAERPPAPAPTAVWQLAEAVVASVSALGPDAAARFVRSPGLQEVCAALLALTAAPTLALASAREEPRDNACDEPRMDAPGDAGRDEPRDAGRDAADLADAHYRPTRVALAVTLDAAVHASEDSEALALLSELLRALDHGSAPPQRVAVRALLASPSYPRLLALVLALPTTSAEQRRSLGELVAALSARCRRSMTELPSMTDEWPRRWGDLVGALLLTATALGPAPLAQRERALCEQAFALLRIAATTEHGRALAPPQFAALARVALAVVGQPATLTQSPAAWLDIFFRAVAETASEPATRQALPAAAIAAQMDHLLAVLCARPDIAAATPTLPSALLGSMFAAVSELSGAAPGELLDALLPRVYAVLTARPALLAAGYPQVLAALTGELSRHLRARDLCTAEAAAMLRATAVSLSENPRLFLETEPRLAGWVIDIVLSSTRERPRLSSVSSADIAAAALSALERCGHAALSHHGGTPLAHALQAVLTTTLDAAERNLGVRISIGDIPAVLGVVLDFWSQGRVGEAAYDETDFRECFDAAVRIARDRR
ncbi:hypothetical protein [Haliangium ochraceum]|uniref:Uncharacterized protein n=1 Tax=Haliangium ochraceum (strain DSM 14365 / JCM 11303 / SMP-2) TaxID=502025 RepID=D0LSY8_HALO1|nr:hypothetical protein [Haliangium ochraceum]ACY19124.1 hypothetical protein Hoch_6658 [Haliangium ochraceum DSM 14365]